MGRKLIMAIISVLISLLFLARPALAASPKFSANTDISYQITADGRATVTQNFSLKNLTSEFAPGQYVFQPGLKQFEKVRAFGPNGALNVSAQQKNGLWEITVGLPNLALGIDKTESWTVVYETSEVARQNGRLWEILVPRPADVEGLENFSLSLSLPPTFGKKVYLQPEPASQNANNLVWSNNNLKGAIFAVFDPSMSTDQAYQTYNFQLNYTLTNSRLYPVQVEIGLPSDSTFQKVFLNDLNPKPVNVRADEGGNWLAKYQLGPASNLNIAAVGSVALFAAPKFPAGEIHPEKFLTRQDFWESNDRQIVLLAQRLHSGENIYRFVIENIKAVATQNNAVRAGAKKTLSARQGSALDIADLFVAICRAAGVPAREAFGFARGVPSVWPEYFDFRKGGWISVDPVLAIVSPGTDSLTKSDLSHVTLQTNGLDSKLPVLPQANLEYRRDGLNLLEEPKVGLRLDIPKEIIAGFPSQATVYVENYGPTFFSGQIVSLEASQLAFKTPRVETGGLPPFSNRPLAFAIEPTSFTMMQSDIITLEFEKEKRQYTTQIKPFYKNSFLLIISFLFLLGIISLVAQIARSILFSRHPR